MVLSTVLKWVLALREWRWRRSERGDHRHTSLISYLSVGSGDWHARHLPLCFVGWVCQNAGMSGAASARANQGRLHDCQACLFRRVPWCHSVSSLRRPPFGFNNPNRAPGAWTRDSCCLIMVASVSAGSGHITNHNQDGAQGMVPIRTGSLPRAHAYFDFNQSESFPTILRSKPRPPFQ
jgi:hypothetical protein